MASSRPWWQIAATPAWALREGAFFAVLALACWLAVAFVGSLRSLPFTVAAVVLTLGAATYFLQAAYLRRP